MLKVPNYRGIWTSEEKDFGLFYIWLEKGDPQNPAGLSGKCWENYNGSLDESIISSLKKEKNEILFIKQYKNPRADLLKKFIMYRGLREDYSKLFKGIWNSTNCEERKLQGLFYLADNPMNIGEFEKRLANLHINQFERKLEDLQRAFPFTPLI